MLMNAPTVLYAFILTALGICSPSSAYGGQVKSTSNSGAQLSTETETGKPPVPNAKEVPSCTAEMPAQGKLQTSSHSVSLAWRASTSTAVIGYNVYRRAGTSGEFIKINQKPVAATSCIDYFVGLGQTYYYYVTAFRPGVPESIASNLAPAQIPPR